MAIAASLSVWGEGLSKVVPTLSAGDVTLSCESPLGWNFDTSLSSSQGVEYLTVKLSREAPSVPPQFQLSFSIQQRDMHHLWTVNETSHFALKPDWASQTRSNIAVGMPLWEFFDDSDANGLTVACDEVFRDVVANMGLREEGCVIIGRIRFFTVPEAPRTDYSVTVRLDARDAFWADCVREAALWMRESSGCEPCHVPDAAFEPLYSSWYQFHQDLHQKDVEEELALASSLGMKTVIIDDGWQTDDTGRGYAYCGDWKVSANRFPSFADHVRRVQDMGMKYMMWYSVPFIGFKSENFEHFAGKYLYLNEGLGAGTLDPRFPEVRKFLIDLYVKAAQDWGLDGFKLDFIDSFTWGGNDPAVAENYAGRDIKTVPEAVRELMVGVRDALQARNPEVLIEFRQAYVGPAIAMFGNMFRVGDCPGEHMQNRIGICNMRLGAPGIAIHSDMIEWNVSESPEQAARAIMSALFGVVQYSVMLRDIPQAHRDVIRRWLDFSQAHKDALLRGSFRPHHPEAGYPLIEAWNDSERIIGVYQQDVTVPVPLGGTPVYVLNATSTPTLCLDLGAGTGLDGNASGSDTPGLSPAGNAPGSVTAYRDVRGSSPGTNPAGKRKVKAEVFDLYGRSAGTVTLRPGLTRIPVPVGGHLLLR